MSAAPHSLQNSLPHTEVCVNLTRHIAAKCLPVYPLFAPNSITRVGGGGEGVTAHKENVLGETLPGNVRFDVLTEVLKENQVFWHVPLCCWVNSSWYLFLNFLTLKIKAQWYFESSKTTHPITESYPRRPESLTQENQGLFSLPLKK
jgi:hypothetical protein